MAKAKEAPEAVEKPTTLALVPQVSVSRAIIGTVEQKIMAFDQVAANLAQLAINGWNKVQYCKAACWLADGIGEHPAVFMQNHYCMEIKGRLTVTSKWQYKIRKLKETVPGFRFKILEETDTKATVWMSDGVDEHTVSYSVEDARRQGLFGRTGGNMWTEGNTREGCLKSAVQRCADRLGVGRSGAPWVEVEDLEPPSPPVSTQPQSRAEVVENESYPAGAEGGSGGAAPPTSSATPPAPVEAGGGPAPGGSAPGKAAEPAVRGPQPSKEKSPVLLLSTRLVKMYGRQPVAVALEKASMLYNQMQLEQTGVDPHHAFRKPSDIGPADAKNLLDWLDEREKKGRATAPAGGMDAPPAPESDEPPPAEEVASGEPEAEGLGSDITTLYDDLMETVKKARSLLGRKFVTEAPPGSGKYWYVDQATFTQIGKDNSMLLMKEGEIMVAQQDLLNLLKVLRDDCAKHERGGR